MAEMEIISEKPVSLVEMKEKLEEIKKRDKELNFRAKKTDEYLNFVTKIKPKKLNDLKEALEKLDIQRLKDKHIIKIVDVMPQDLDSVKMIFANEPLALKQEDMAKILDVVKKHA